MISGGRLARLPHPPQRERDEHHAGLRAEQDRLARDTGRRASRQAGRRTAAGKNDMNAREPEPRRRVRQLVEDVRRRDRLHPRARVRDQRGRPRRSRSRGSAAPGTTRWPGRDVGAGSAVVTRRSPRAPDRGRRIPRGGPSTGRRPSPRPSPSRTDSGRQRPVPAAPVVHRDHHPADVPAADREALARRPCTARGRARPRPAATDVEREPVEERGDAGIGPNPPGRVLAFGAITLTVIPCGGALLRERPRAARRSPIFAVE